MGGDWSVTTANPLERLEIAVGCIDPGIRGNVPFRSEERLSLPAASAQPAVATGRVVPAR